MDHPNRPCLTIVKHSLCQYSQHKEYNEDIQTVTPM